MKKLILLVVFIYPSTFLSAQDFLFNDYTNVPIVLNPAFTGSDCGPRLAVSSQRFISPYQVNKTFGISFDMPIQLSNGYSIGVGGRYFKELKGYFSDFTGILFSGSIRKKIMGKNVNHTISFGIEGGRLNKEYTGGLSQVGVIVHGTMTDIEIINIFTHLNSVTKFNYYVLNTGITWKTEFSNKTSLVLGTAFYQINSPTISLGSDDYTFGIRSQLSARLQTKITKNLDLLPTVYFIKQEQSDLYNAAMLGKYKLSNSSNISGGIGYVNTRHLYVTAMVELKKLAFGINYGFSKQRLVEATVKYSFGECK